MPPFKNWDVHLGPAGPSGQYYLYMYLQVELLPNCKGDARGDVAGYAQDPAGYLSG